MFLKIGELKKAMKSALKPGGLTVGNYRGHYLVCTDWWGAWVDRMYATNKFKAAIMELVGELPEEDECCLFTMVEKEVCTDTQASRRDPFEEWKQAKDYAYITPLLLNLFPHEFAVFQRHSAKGYFMCLRDYTSRMISDSELEAGMESMPNRPSVSPNGNCLFFKSETMIYWVCRTREQDKVRDTLFRSLGELDFSRGDWQRGRCDEEREEE